MSIFRFGNLTTEPEIHRGGGKQKRGERRIPCAVKNVTGDDEEIFSRRPRSDAPVKRDDDHEENDERERVKKHDEKSIRLTCRSLHPIYVSHIEGSFLIVVLSPCKIKKRIKCRRDFLWSPSPQLYLGCPAALDCYLAACRPCRGSQPLHSLPH